MNDRYKLEDAVFAIAQISSDIELAYEAHLDFPDVMTEDQVSNMLMGLLEMAKLRSKKLEVEYKKFFELDEYRYFRRCLNNEKDIEEIEEEAAPFPFITTGEEE